VKNWEEQAMRSMCQKQLLAFIGVVVGVQIAAAQERLILTSLSPAGSPNSIFYQAWAKRVTDASKGTLKVEVRDGTALANFGNTYVRTMDNVVQIGWVLHSLVAGKFPLSEVTNLPFMSDGHTNCSVALWRLYKSGALDSEYKDVVPMWFGCLNQSGMHFAKPMRSNVDLSGLKLRVSGRVASQLVERMGGTPISMRGGSMYEALQRGTIDGAVTSWSAFEPYKLAEVTYYHLEVPAGASPSMFFMSRKKYESLPAAARKALDDARGEAQSRAFGVHIYNQGLRARTPVASSAKHKIVQLDAQQSKTWQEKVAPVRDGWVKEHPGRDKVLKAFQEIHEQVAAGH
jgi:TRAP-type C4-dicarboxylate transport system substrate-binding protein